MKRFYKLFMVVTTVIVLIFMLLGCNKSVYKVSEEVVLSNVDNIVLEDMEEVPLETTLTSSILLSEEVSTLSTGSKSKVIKATAYPDDAGNKDVTWNVSWGNYTGNNIVTDYVNISSTNKYCEVTCIKAFYSRTILVTATSVQNPEVQATCTVSYIGLPEVYKSSYIFTSTLNDLDYTYNLTSKGQSFFIVTGESDLGSSGYSMDLELVNVGASGTFLYNGSSSGNLSGIVSSIFEVTDVEGDYIYIKINNLLSDFVSSNYGSYSGVNGHFYITVKDKANSDALITIKFIC